MEGLLALVDPWLGHIPMFPFVLPYLQTWCSTPPPMDFWDEDRTRCGSGRPTTTFNNSCLELGPDLELETETDLPSCFLSPKEEAVTTVATVATVATEKGKVNAPERGEAEPRTPVMTCRKRARVEEPPAKIPGSPAKFAMPMFPTCRKPSVRVLLKFGLKL